MQVDLTPSIKAIDLPEGAYNIEFSNYIETMNLTYNVLGNTYISQFDINSELLGVIQGGVIPEELAIEILDEEVMGKIEKGERVEFEFKVRDINGSCKRFLIFKGLDLSKTIVIIKVTS